MPSVNQRHHASAGHPEDALIEAVQTLPVAEALQRYAALPTALQWLARRRTTGPRRALLIEHHAVAIAHCR